MEEVRGEGYFFNKLCIINKNINNIAAIILLFANLHTLSGQ
jgi:hypothetical protein